MTEEELQFFKGYFDILSENQAHTVEALQEISQKLTDLQESQKTFQDDIWQTIADQKQADALAQEQEEQAEADAAEQPLPYAADFQKVNDQLSGLTEQIDSINQFCSAYDPDLYSKDFQAMQEQQEKAGSTAQQTNSFLTVIGFGVFIIAGLLLARIVWRRI